jgi:hypothetical protein
LSEVIEITLDDPAAVLTDEARYSAFRDVVKAAVAGQKPNTSTVAGRKAIASLAYKIARTKTAIDDAGKKLNEDARAKINAVDAQRRKIRQELDDLAAEARKPLTEWEEAEQRRANRAAIMRGDIDRLRRIEAGDGSNLIADRLAQLHAITPDPAAVGGEADALTAKRDAAVVAVETALANARQHEADQAELARLRAEREEQERQERERAEREAAEKAERERKEREAAEAKRREEAAAEGARQEVEQKAEAERRRHEAEIAAAKRAAEEAAAKAEAEKKAMIAAQERQEAERKAAAERAEKEAAARAADREHRGKIMGAAKAAIMGLGPDEETARKIVLAIVANEVPHVTLSF